jgi:autotransporter-associated beta strand protein
MKPRMLAVARLSLPLAMAIAAMLAVPATQAATGTKADNADTLSLASSWDTLPGAADIAQWNNIVSAANSNTVLGSNLTWAGINIVDPGGPVTIGGANTLTIGTSGINLNAATQNLTISSGLTVFGKQSWKAAAGRTLNVTGTFTRNGATVDFTDFNSGATLGTLANDASGILGPWATTGSTTSLQYVTSTGGTISAYTGALAAGTNLASMNSGTTNYTYGAAATLAGNQSGNTLRYTGGANITALGTNSLTLNGLMNAGSGALTVTSTAENPGLVIGSSGELDIISNDKALNLSARITGTGKVVYNATGNITLAASASANNYDGGTVINSTNQITAVGAGTWFGSGPVTVNGGTIFFSANTLDNDFTFNGGLATMNNSNVSTLNGTITLATPTTFQLNTTGNMVINGKVTGAGGLTKTQGSANAPLQLTNANNDYAGPTAVTAGVLLVKSSLYGNDTVKWTSANITVDSGATFGLNVGGASDFSTTSAGTMLTNLLTVNNNGLKAGSFFGLSTANATTPVTFSTKLTDSSGTGGGAVGLRKIGTGTLELSGANTYSGKTIINLGELKVSSLNSVNGGSPLLASSSLGRPTTVANGTIEFSAPTAATGAATTSLIYTGTGETTDRVLNLVNQTYGGILDQSGTGVLKFTSDLLAGSGDPARDQRKTLTLQGSTTGTGEIAGIIPNSAATNVNQRATSLSKSGTGMWTLSNTNTYSGATTVTAGTLAVSATGSINNSSGVTIIGGNFRYNATTNLSPAVTFTSGTLSGTNWNGSLSGRTIGAGKTISPGNSPGTATTVAQTWASGGSYLWEINKANGTAGTDPGWDLLSGTGTLTISATVGSEFNLLVTSLTDLNVAGNALGFNDATSYNWLIADFASITGFDTTDFNINTSGFSNTFTGAFGVSLGGGAMPGDNSQIYLTYTAVPEPGAALLGGLGLLALLRRRRSC